MIIPKKLQNNICHKNGMTFIELIIVIAILATMAGLAAASVDGIISTEGAADTLSRLQGIRIAILGKSAKGEENIPEGFLQDIGWLPVSAEDLVVCPFKDSLQNPACLRRYDSNWKSWIGWSGPYYHGAGFGKDQTGSQIIFDGWGNPFKGWLISNADVVNYLGDTNLKHWSQLINISIGTGDISVVEKIAYDCNDSLSPSYEPIYSFDVYSQGSDFKDDDKDDDTGSTTYSSEEKNNQKDLPSNHKSQPLIFPHEWRIDLMADDGSPILNVFLDIRLRDSEVLVVPNGNYRLAFAIPRYEIIDECDVLTFGLPIDPSKLEYVSELYNHTEVVGAICSAEGAESIDPLLFSRGVGKNMRVPCGRRMLFLLQEGDIQPTSFKSASSNTEYILGCEYELSNLITMSTTLILQPIKK